MIVEIKIRQSKETQNSYHGIFYGWNLGHCFWIMDGYIQGINELLYDCRIRRSESVPWSFYALSLHDTRKESRSTKGLKVQTTQIEHKLP